MDDDKQHAETLSNLPPSISHPLECSAIHLESRKDQSATQVPAYIEIDEILLSQNEHDAPPLPLNGPPLERDEQKIPSFKSHALELTESKPTAEEDHQNSPANEDPNNRRTESNGTISMFDPLMNVNGSHPPDPVSTEENTFPVIPWNLARSNRRPSYAAALSEEQSNPSPCIFHPLQLVDIDLGPSPTATTETAVHVAGAAPTDGSANPATSNSDIPSDAPTVIWDLPPPAFNGPSADAAPPSYDEALTCSPDPFTALPRHPYEQDFTFDMEHNRRLSEMRMELQLVKANRKKMYINFLLGIICFIVILLIIRFTLFEPRHNEAPGTMTTSTTTEEPMTSTEEPPPENFN